MTINIKGVYPIEAPEPCVLIEVEFNKYDPNFDWGKITQEIKGQPKENWQAVYDERPINNDKTKWVFFFHYLDKSKPLLTPYGPKTVPKISLLPEYLKHIKYESPC
jgi:hypothetical protein